MKKKIITIAAIVSFAFLYILFSNCQNNKIVYSNGINFENTQSVTVQVLNDTFLFNFPLQMDIMDSLIIIQDKNKGSHFLLFNTKGYFLTHFGNMGKGAGELLSTSGFSICPNLQKIYMFDGLQKKIISCKIADVTTPAKYCIYSLPAIQYSDNIPLLLFDAIPLKADSSFLLTGNNKNFRFGIFDCHHIDTLYNSYPPCIETSNEEEIWSVFSNMATTRIRPDGKRMVHTTYIGGIMELFELNDKSQLNPYKQLFIYEPQYSIFHGSRPTWVNFAKNTQVGFRDVYVTNNYIYSLLNECGNQSFPQRICIFDWEGNPIKQIQLPTGILTLAVSEKTNIIFAITSHESNGYQLISIKIK